MCLYPSIVRNPKYKKNKKNKGRVPWAKDPRILYIPIGCGECIECRKQKTRNWKIRLKEEVMEKKNGKFVTLTISDYYMNELEELIKKDGKTKYEIYNEITAIAIERFSERWRKKYGKAIRHWLTAEIGHQGTKRLHLHGLIFEHSKEDIKEKWMYGFVYIGDYVTERTVNYIAKYITKIDRENPGFKPKVYASKGIGKNYLKKKQAEMNRYNAIRTKDTYSNTNGTETQLPIYYKNKLYTETQRENLWIEKLDKETRYVMGQKIDVSTTDGMYNYQKALKEAQAKNERMGYGKKTEWDIDKYEQDRQSLIATATL